MASVVLPKANICTVNKPVIHSSTNHPGFLSTASFQAFGLPMRAMGYKAGCGAAAFSSKIHWVDYN